jgi:hypothetical protein
MSTSTIGGLQERRILRRAGERRRIQAVSRERSPRRVFILSPANAAGLRGKLLLSESASFALAMRLRETGVPLGDLFTFISGLYFRGKLAYAQAFAQVPSGCRELL